MYTSFMNLNWNYIFDNLKKLCMVVSLLLTINVMIIGLKWYDVWGFILKFVWEFWIELRCFVHGSSVFCNLAVLVWVSNGSERFKKKKKKRIAWLLFCESAETAFIWKKGRMAWWVVKGRKARMYEKGQWPSRD